VARKAQAYKDTENQEVGRRETRGLLLGSHEGRKEFTLPIYKERRKVLRGKKN